MSPSIRQLLGQFKDRSNRFPQKGDIFILHENGAVELNTQFKLEDLFPLQQGDRFIYSALPALDRTGQLHGRVLRTSLRIRVSLDTDLFSSLERSGTSYTIRTPEKR